MDEYDQMMADDSAMEIREAELQAMKDKAIRDAQKELDAHAGAEADADVWHSQFD